MLMDFNWAIFLQQKNNTKKKLHKWNIFFKIHKKLDNNAKKNSPTQLFTRTYRIQLDEESNYRPTASEPVALIAAPIASLEIDIRYKAAINCTETWIGINVCWLTKKY